MAYVEGLPSLRNYFELELIPRSLLDLEQLTRVLQFSNNFPPLTLSTDSIVKQGIGPM